MTTAKETPAVAIAAPDIDVYSNEILRERLAAGLGNQGGARGSLTRCVGKAMMLRNTVDGSDNAVQEMQRELQLVDIELTKLYWTVQRQRAELEQARQEQEPLQAAIADERVRVNELRQTMQQAALTKACRNEYEALTKIVNTKHPVGPRALQAQLDELLLQLEATQEKSQTATSHVRIRQAQFQNFLQSLLDLKQSLTEGLVLDEHEFQPNTDEETHTPMDLEPSEVTVETTAVAKSEEEVDLYDDL